MAVHDDVGDPAVTTHSALLTGVPTTQEARSGPAAAPADVIPHIGGEIPPTVWSEALPGPQPIGLAPGRGSRAKAKHPVTARHRLAPDKGGVGPLTLSIKGLAPDMSCAAKSTIDEMAEEIGAAIPNSTGETHGSCERGGGVPVANRARNSRLSVGELDGWAMK